MNSDIESLAAISRGFRNAKERLHALRVKEIRESDIRLQLSGFNGLLEHALRNKIDRKPVRLGRAMRVFLAIEK